MTKKLSKGQEMEELLRSYFLQAGYYVMRGVPFQYEGFDVTDIDLWLYNRTSPVARNISIVDIKNKRTPQAIERIFWTKGLSQALNADNAIVATTEKRTEVKEFGNKLGVLVLDGAFLSKLSKSENHFTRRLSDEEFIENIQDYDLGKLDGDWKGKIIECKSLLSSGLTFDTCNKWLDISKFFAEQVLTKPSRVETALRCFYFSLSFVAISIDFILKELSFLDQSERLERLSEGFTYGSKGKEGMDKTINLSLGLVDQFSPEGSGITSQIRSRIDHEFASLPTQTLGEYFSKNDVGRLLFNNARELESLSMSRSFSSHVDSSAEIRGLIGCLLDYWSISRTDFSSSAKYA